MGRGGWLRERVVRLVDEVFSHHHQIELVELASLREEVGELRAELAQQVERMLEHARQVEIRDRHDLFAAGERQALGESAKLIVDAMPHASRFPHPTETLEHALSIAPTGGLALEFGVFTGSTLKVIAATRADTQVYGFDSFDGLPEDWRSGFSAGAFTVTSVPEVPGAELVVGWFTETLPGFLAGHPGPVDLVHVDCDLYSSTQTVLDLVGPRLQVGSVIVFDEYFNYPGWQEHEHRAWMEYVARTGTEFSYQGYTIDNEQVIVRVDAL